MVNLDAIKQRMAELNSQNEPKAKKEKKDYTKIYWKPREEGEYTIRVVPSVLGKKLPLNPFQEVYVHYNITQYPSLSLINWGEEDPIVNFANNLEKSGDVEKWKLGKKLQPKLRVVIPVIVRGEENKGVRLFEISKTLYTEMAGYFTKPKFGDFTDVNDGYDFILTATKRQGNPGFNITIAADRANSPLSEDADNVNTWLTEQPLLLEERAKLSPEALKEALKQYILELEGETETEEPDVISDEEDEDTEPLFPSKQTPKDKFQNLFD